MNLWSDPQIVLGTVQAVTSFLYLVATFFIARATIQQSRFTKQLKDLQETIERTSRVVDLAMELGKGGWGKDGEQAHNQDWIEVTNLSPTGVRVSAITIEAEREDRTVRRMTQPANHMVKPFSTKRINIYSEMSRVAGPLTPVADKPIRAKGLVRMTLQYKAYGKEFTTEPSEFVGEFGYGEFWELQGPTEIEVREPPATPGR